jgi:hypothetical protein
MNNQFVNVRFAEAFETPAERRKNAKEVFVVGVFMMGGILEVLCPTRHQSFVGISGGVFG